MKAKTDERQDKNVKTEANIVEPTAQPAEQNPPIVTKNSKKKRLIISSLVVALLLAVAAGGFAYWHWHVNKKKTNTAEPLALFTPPQ